MPTDPTRSLAAEARALVVAATKGPDADPDDHICAMCDKPCSLTSPELEPTDLCNLCAQDIAARAPTLLAELADALEASRAECEKLRAALRPFAECPMATATRVVGDPVESMVGITVGHFRAARAALDEGKG